MKVVLAILLCIAVGTNASLSCSMCKSLLPMVGTHECATKCSAWWSWTQSACDGACDALITYLPNKYPCAAAGYCPWTSEQNNLRGAADDLKIVQQLFKGVGKGLAVSFDVDACIFDAHGTAASFKDAAAKLKTIDYHHIIGVEEGLRDLAVVGKSLEQTLEACHVPAIIGDIRTIIGIFSNPMSILKVIAEDAVVIYTHKVDITTDIKVMTTAWDAQQYEAAGEALGKIISVVVL